MSYKVVCTDIDGTLLDAQRELSAATIAAFRSLPADVIVVLASSRMPSAMFHLQEQLGVRHYPMICYNGGFTVHYNTGSAGPEVLHNEEIPLDLCALILDCAAGTDIHSSLYYQDDWYAPRWDYWTERESTITKTRPAILDNSEALTRWRTTGHGAHKIMCMGPEHEIEHLQNVLLEKTSGRIHIYRSRPTYLELAPSGISKGSALQLLLQKKYGIQMQDVVAFGDNYNDTEMIRMAGHGVAVLNSREEVKAVANEITVDSKEDGVALTLRRLFL